MLNPRLRDQIQHVEYRVLYDLKIPLSDPHLSQSVSNCIKQIRNKYNSRNVRDFLDLKAKQYPQCGDWAKAKIAELEKVIYDENKTVPATDHGQWRSIEFELIFNNEAAMFQFVKEVRGKGLAKFVTIKHDGSLRIDDGDRTGGICKEVVVTYKTGSEDNVRYVCQALKGKAYVNNTCGTHVHFDMRNADERTARQYGKRLARCVPALRLLLPPMRRKSKYCLNPINEFHGSNNDRYSFVNMQAYTKYRTIEIRGHSGTLNANKILMWVAMCEKIMATRVRTKTGEVCGVDELIKVYKFDGALKEYINERYKTFNVLSKIDVPAPVQAQLEPIF